MRQTFLLQIWFNQINRADLLAKPLRNCLPPVRSNINVNNNRKKMIVSSSAVVAQPQSKSSRGHHPSRNNQSRNEKQKTSTSFGGREQPSIKGITVLGNAEKSGVNLSRVINQAVSVVHAKPSPKQPPGSSGTAPMNYSAIQDFAQDQLTHISRKEYMEDRDRQALRIKRNLLDSQKKQQHKHKQPDSLDKRKSSILISESVLSQAPSRDNKNRTSTSFNTAAAAVLLCSQHDCHRAQYRGAQCKHHFAQRVKKAFRLNFKHMYRGPEQAFNAMDFTGKGYILATDIYGSPVMQRVRFSKDEVEFSFNMLNLFNNVSAVSAIKDGVPPNGMSFDKFREIFFPQLHILDEENQSDEDKNVKEMGRQYSEHKERQATKLADRIKQLDLKIQTKLSENYQTVRKAFLALDKDFDGAVTIEDFLHYFGTEPLEYEDLQKLLCVKDRNGKGRIDFTDFGKWFGSAIHKSEGFYFRHDSKMVNPPFNLNAQRFNRKYPEKDLDQCKQSYNEKLIEQIVSKIYYQWKTMRKAFTQLDISKNGVIVPKDLRFYLKHWGVVASEEKFQELFNYFDADGDGKISYKDFQQTIGKEIQPDQGMYWRQDMPRQTRIKSCKYEHCWHVAQDFTVFCKIHLKMMQSKAFLLMQDMKLRMGSSKWNDFIAMLRAKSDPDDPEQLFVDDFIATLRYFRIKLSQSQLDQLVDCFPGRKEGQRPRIRVGRFYDISVAIQHARTYKKLNVESLPDGVHDHSGYTGQMHRKKPAKESEPLSEAELVAMFLLDNTKVSEFMRYCREIDPDKNGVVTVVEIDDILRILYPEQLEGRDLTEIYEPFCSANNKILLDYKAFRDMLHTKMHEIEVNFQLDNSMSAQHQRSEKKQDGRPHHHGSNSEEKTIRIGGDADLEADESWHISRRRSKHKSLNETMKNARPGHPASKQLSSPGVVTIKELLGKNNTTKRPRYDDNSPDVSSGKLHMKTISDFFNRALGSGGTATLSQNGAVSPENHKVIDEISPYDDIGNLHPHQTADHPSPTRPAVHRQRNRPCSSVGSKLTSSQLRSSHQLQQQSTKEESSSWGAIQRPARGPSQSRNNLSHQLRTTDYGNLRALEDSSLTPLYEIGENSPVHARVSTAMSRDMGLRGSQRLDDRNQRQRENIKAKVAYEWKTIFKNLNKMDTGQAGYVTRKQFQNACSQAGVSLSNDEVRRASLLFGSRSQHSETAAETVDYNRMSRELKLHYSSLNYVSQPAHSQAESLKSVVTAGKARKDLKRLNTDELRQMIQGYRQKHMRTESGCGGGESSLSRGGGTASFQSTSAAAAALRASVKGGGEQAGATRAASMSTMTDDKRITMQSHLLTLQIQDEKDKRKRISNILTKRREEFIGLVQSMAKRKGGSGTTTSTTADRINNASTLPVSDFKQIINALGIKLSPREFKQIVQRSAKLLQHDGKQPSAEPLNKTSTSQQQSKALKLGQPHHQHQQPYRQTIVSEQNGGQSGPQIVFTPQQAPHQQLIRTPGPGGKSLANSHLGSETALSGGQLHHLVYNGAEAPHQSRKRNTAAASHSSWLGAPAATTLPATAFTSLSQAARKRHGSPPAVTTGTSSAINVNEFLRMYS